MNVTDIRDFFRDLSKDNFSKDFAHLVKDETFSAVASGVGSDAEIRVVGTQLQQAGLTNLDPTNHQSVLDAARAVTGKVYELYYHP